MGAYAVRPIHCFHPCGTLIIFIDGAQGKNLLLLVLPAVMDNNFSSAVDEERRAVPASLLDGGNAYGSGILDLHDADRLVGGHACSHDSDHAARPLPFGADGEVMVL